MNNRRPFIQWLPSAACGLVAAPRALAQASLVDEKSPQVAGLGDVADAATADKAKFKSFAAGQA